MGQIVFDLFDHQNTIYHRTAMGGLASTIAAWRGNQPKGIKASFDMSQIVIDYDDIYFEEEAKKKAESSSKKRAVKVSSNNVLEAVIDCILKASFKVTEEGFIDIVGHRIPSNDLDTKIAIHNCISISFLQHGKKRPLNKSLPGKIMIEGLDDDKYGFYSYKPVLNYNLQKDFKINSNFDTVGQDCIPGVYEGAFCHFQASWKDLFLLRYVIAGSFLYSVDRNCCIVFSAVNDLEKFVKFVYCLNCQNVKFSKNECSVSDAILSIDLVEHLGGSSIFARDCIDELYVLEMGKVAWLGKEQKNRKAIIDTDLEFDNLALYKQARTMLRKELRLSSVKSEGYYVLCLDTFCSFLAKNIVEKRHWAFRLNKYCSEKIGKMLNFDLLRQFKRKEINKMINLIEDKTDKLFIEVCQKLLERHYAEWYSSGKSPKTIDSKIDAIRCKINGFKTTEQYRKWFIHRFCSVSNGYSIDIIEKNKQELWTFISDKKNFDRCRDLTVFAMISYVGNESKLVKEDDKSVVDNTVTTNE